MKSYAVRVYNTWEAIPELISLWPGMPHACMSWHLRQYLLVFFVLKILFSKFSNIGIILIMLNLYFLNLHFWFIKIAIVSELLWRLSLIPWLWLIVCLCPVHNVLLFTFNTYLMQKQRKLKLMKKIMLCPQFVP